MHQEALGSIFPHWKKIQMCEYMYINQKKKIYCVGGEDMGVMWGGLHSHVEAWRSKDKFVDLLHSCLPLGGSRD